ncbi:hypothetical protein AVEN_6778-1, partial [Araneus ventricosus]
NVPLRRSKSAAAGDSQRKCQNGYRTEDGASQVLEKQINCNSSQTFSLRVPNCRSPGKNPIKFWHEQFKGPGKVLDNHRSQTKLLYE